MILPKKLTHIPVLLLSVVILNSCATYRLTPLQLYTQIHDATRKQVTIECHMMIGTVISTNLGTYMANGVKEISCTDKHGNLATLTNSPQVEMKIIDKKHHRHIFYFDTVLLTDSTFSGLNSRILGTHKSIDFADIESVEVQNGHKDYYYVGQ